MLPSQRSISLTLLVLSSVTAFVPLPPAKHQSKLQMGVIGSATNAVTKLGGPTTAAIATAAVVGTAGIKFVLDRPSRKYEEGSVAREYDAWTRDGILEIGRASCRERVYCVV